MNKLLNGEIHQIPKDVSKNIENKNFGKYWNDLTPLSRNEWICWIESAKKLETRERRIKIMLDKFGHGDRRPCCWAGCTHR